LCYTLVITLLIPRKNGIHRNRFEEPTSGKVRGFVVRIK
jgi:hypothetical protein